MYGIISKDGGVKMAKQKFTTTIDSELLEKIKIKAIREKRSVSDILEELIKNYLENDLED